MKNKKILVVIIVIILAIVAVVEIYAGMSIAATKFFNGTGGGSFKHFANYTSDDGMNTISIQAQEPVWSFGQSNVPNQFESWPSNNYSRIIE